MINKNRLFKIFGELVSIDSPSFGERQVADYLINLGKERNINFIEDTAGKQLGGNAGNLYAYIEGAPGTQPILLSSHMDTVEPSKGKRAVLHENGLITSAGDTILGADDLAGIAIILEALISAKENKIKTVPVELLFTIAEEPYCKGITAFDIAKLKSDKAYVLDLTGPIGSAAYKAPIILSFKAVIHGRPAHAGFEPEKGIHAIKLACKALSFIDCGKLEDVTLNIGTINGGNLNNIVPEYCTLTGEIRSYNNYSAYKKCEEIKNIFEKICNEAEAELNFETTEHFKAYETDLEDLVVTNFLLACKKLGIEPKLQKTFGGSDNNFLSSHGIRGLVLASAMNNCHSLEEYSSIDDMELAALLLLKLISTEE